MNALFEAASMTDAAASVIWPAEADRSTSHTNPCGHKKLGLRFAVDRNRTFESVGLSRAVEDPPKAMKSVLTVDDFHSTCHRSSSASYASKITVVGPAYRSEVSANSVNIYTPTTVVGGKVAVNSSNSRACSPPRVRCHRTDRRTGAAQCQRHGTPPHGVSGRCPGRVVPPDGTQAWASD